MMAFKIKGFLTKPKGVHVTVHGKQFSSTFSKTKNVIQHLPQEHHRVPSNVISRLNPPHFVQKSFFASEAKPPKALVPSPTKSIAPKIMWLTGNELPAKAGAVDIDKTANVYLTLPPNGHEEDPDVAHLLGVNHFYRSPNSYYVLKFDPKEINAKFEDYVDMFKLDFYSRVPYGLISPLFLNSELIAHIDPSLKYEAFFLDKKGRPDLAQRPAEMVLILRTPGGFWTVTCTSTFYAIAAQKDNYFVPLMRNLRIDLLDQGAPKETAATSNDVSIDLPKMDTSPKKGSRLRKRVKLSILQQGNIGDFGVKENPNPLDDDSLE